MISTTTSQQAKHVIALQKKARMRREEKVYIVEGIKMFSEIPIKDLDRIYVSESFYKANRDMFPGDCYGVGGQHIEVAADFVFAQMSDTQTPQGIMAIVRQREYSLEELLGNRDKPLLLMLENIQDPGNLGTIFRSAEGAGVTGIVMSEGTVDVYNSKVIRSTMGSMFRVPFIYTQDMKHTCDTLHSEYGIKLYAAHLKGEQSYDKEAYISGCGFMIGNESKGLSDEICAMADAYVQIPMLGQVESLNAGVAAALLVFEAARQRRGRR